ncbi:lipopolysaccharide biosynthesis protein [Perlucidibaca aquatica]|uniref:lipopolysaccharide biosynthesis protein n=1 Tax=Perlucidibaca aquatica TaxID=1852776 RepID=UPI00083AF767|nr:MATE family efflux transporter [Perlucidibaca aquatica]
MKFIFPSRIKKIFFAVFLGKGLMAGRQLLLVPVFLSAWGVDYYGKWLVLSALPTFLSMSNLGVGTSANIAIAIEASAQRKDNAERIFLTSQWMILAVAFLTILFLLIFMQLTGWGDEENQLEHARLILIFLLVGVFVQMLASPIFGWWTSIGKPEISYRMLNTLSIASIAISIFIPSVGGSALDLSIGMLICNIVWLAYVNVRTYRALEWSLKVYSRQLFDFSLSKKLLQTGLGHQLTPLWQGVFFQGSIIMAGSMLGPSGAALWGTLRIVIRSGNQVLELVSQTLWTEFQALYARKDVAALRRMHRLGLLISLALSSLVALFLATCGPFLFDFWTGGKFVVDNTSWFALICSLIPFSLWWLSSEMLRAVNRPWLINAWALAFSLVFLILIQLLKVKGIAAFSISSLIFDLLMMAVIIPTVHKFLRELERNEDGKSLGEKQ